MREEIVLGGRDMPECTCDFDSECAVYAWVDEEHCVRAIVAFLLWGGK